MNTSSVIKMCIVQKINHAYKMGTVKQANSKSRTYYVYNDIIDLENFKQKLTENHIKTSVFTRLNILQLKKMMIVKLFTA